MLEVSHLLALGAVLLLMTYVAVVDIRFMIIPDGVNAAIFLLGMAASLTLRIVDPVSALAASILGGGFLLLVQTVFRIVRGYDGLGRGDVKFVAAAATWTGVEGVAFALLVASVSALLYVLVRHVLDHGFDLHRRIPFGPFLALGAASVATVQIISGMAMTDIVDAWLQASLGHNA